MISAITVPSGSIADVYWSAKGKVTLVREFAGNLRVGKDGKSGWSLQRWGGEGSAYLTSVRDPPPKLGSNVLSDTSSNGPTTADLLVIVPGIPRTMPKRSA